MRRLMLSLACVLLATATLFASSYSSSFSATENPISEGGHWTGGQSAGNNLWGDVETNGTIAFGATQPTAFGDPTAILTGTWAPDQTAIGTVAVPGTTNDGSTYEVEVRLRFTINAVAHTITGYEVYCSVAALHPYCHIAGWGGPSGVFKNLDECAGVSYTTALVTGNRIKGTVTGSNPSVVTLFTDEGSGFVQRFQISDNGNIGGNCLYVGDNLTHGPYTSGNPGMGFFEGAQTNLTHMGFSAFSATDGTSGPARLHTFRIGL